MLTLIQSLSCGCLSTRVVKISYVDGSIHAVALNPYRLLSQQVHTAVDDRYHQRAMCVIMNADIRLKSPIEKKSKFGLK